MYAINHAATALIIKKKSPETPLFALLIAAQFVELLWVFFNYMGIEHIAIRNGVLHLNFLPYSHSVFTALVLALIIWSICRVMYHNSKLGIALAIGIISHTILDILFHEPDIHVVPFLNKPLLGLNITSYPLLDFALETMYGIFCWMYFKGNKGLLIAIITFNLLDLPMMMGKGDALIPFQHNHALLPSLILTQIVATWLFVWMFGRQRNVTKKPKLSASLQSFSLLSQAD